MDTTMKQPPENGPGSVARKISRDFIRKNGRKPSMFELDMACRDYVEPAKPVVSRRTGRKIFRFAW